MKIAISLTFLVLFTSAAQATDCFDLAGKDYGIDPDLVRAITWNESKFETQAIGVNPVTGFGSGLMQIDSQHFPELKRYGITPEHLINDACMNIYTGTYYLAIAFKKWGVNWNAVGAYNAGFKQNKTQAIRRYNYAAKIYATYTTIKRQKSAQRGQ